VAAPAQQALINQAKHLQSKALAQARGRQLRESPRERRTMRVIVAVLQEMDCLQRLSKESHFFHTANAIEFVSIQATTTKNRGGTEQKKRW
jgi:hypothetical protein